ncbi:(2Fe-2S)-binding protein [Dyella flagellata]|uniref:(2Fe-2S)-binding protein n=1 Tax=Dyella flagellata TaxID=1867833 RepID=A0ABQ5XBH3_9GAMM|nr:(2Fe-2S)-binding protein [Dyella flagellata]GLQ88599.1 (2Fe-2S)-binding protein [Dyella flagellata]
MNQVRIAINGQALDVPAGISVAAAIARLQWPFRRSPRGQARAAFCGMGVCFECRVRIDGIAQQRACMVPVREGMQVMTDE